MSELIYIPEHFVSVEAGAGLGSRTRQIPMTDNLGIRKHLIKDGQQVGEPLCLSRSSRVARQSVPHSRCLWNNGCTARREPLLPAACGAASSCRHGGYKNDTLSYGICVRDGHGTVAPQCSLGCTL